MTNATNETKSQNQGCGQNEVVRYGNYQEKDDFPTLLERNINENKTPRKLLENLPTRRSLPSLIYRGKPCLLRLLLKGNLKNSAASLSLRKNVKGKNIRSAAHLCKIILSTNRNNNNSSIVNAKRNKSSKVSLKSPVKVVSRIAEEEEHSHFTFDCSNNNDKAKNTSPLSPDQQSKSSSRIFKRAILTPIRKINATPILGQQLKLNEETNHDIDIIIEGLFGGGYPNIIQLVFGAFCDCRETKSIAQMLLKAKPGKLSNAQIFLSRYLEMMHNAENSIKTHGDCEKKRNYGSSYEKVDNSVKMHNSYEPSSSIPLSFYSRHIDDKDKTSLEELNKKTKIAKNFAEKSIENMEETSLVQSLFCTNGSVDSISLVKLLVLEEFDMKAKQCSSWSIARLMLTPNPDSGDSVLDLLTSDDNIPVARNLLSELVQGELGENPSLARLAIEKGLIHFLLKGEEQGKQSILRLLIHEFSESQSPSIFFNKIQLKKMLNNENASWYVDKMCKLGMALLHSTLELTPLSEYLYEAAVESSPVDDLCDTLGIENSSREGLKSFMRSLKSSSLDFFSSQFDQVSGVSIVFIAFLGLICGWRVRDKLVNCHGASTSDSFQADKLLHEIRWWQRGLLKRSNLVADTVHKGTAWQVLLERCAISIQPEGKCAETFEAIAMTMAKEFNASGNRIDIVDRIQDILSIICLDKIDIQCFENNLSPEFLGELCQFYWKSENVEDCRKILIEMISKVILQE